MDTREPKPSLFKEIPSNLEFPERRMQRIDTENVSWDTNTQQLTIQVFPLVVSPHLTKGQIDYHFPDEPKDGSTRYPNAKRVEETIKERDVLTIQRTRKVNISDTVSKYFAEISTLSRMNNPKEPIGMTFEWSLARKFDLYPKTSFFRAAYRGDGRLDSLHLSDEFMRAFFPGMSNNSYNPQASFPGMHINISDQLENYSLSLPEGTNPAETIEETVNTSQKRVLVYHTDERDFQVVLEKIEHTLQIKIKESQALRQVIMRMPLQYNDLQRYQIEAASINWPQLAPLIDIQLLDPSGNTDLLESLKHKDQDELWFTPQTATDNVISEETSLSYYRRQVPNEPEIDSEKTKETEEGGEDKVEILPLGVGLRKKWEEKD